MSEVAQTHGEVLFRVDSLAKHYPVMSGTVRRRETASLRALDGVSFSLRAGETLGLVGESGCGKSTLAQTLMRLVEPTSGSAYYRDVNIYGMNKGQLREYRRSVQMVFQDPFESLNPRKTVGQIIAEPWAIHPEVLDRSRRRSRVLELLELVGMRPEHIDRFPAQFSGGQRQRIGVARALALNPEVIVCDEPVSALDVSVQAQVVNLLADLQAELGLAYIFIAHDLGVVRHVSDSVGVMYLGKMVEYGTKDDVFRQASHPYTQALLAASPHPRFQGRSGEPAKLLKGDLPSPVDPPSGCSFRTRCWHALDACAETEPLLETAPGQRHIAACHLMEEVRIDRRPAVATGSHRDRK